MDVETEVLKREWFYPYELPSGQVAPTYHGGRLDAIHATRLAMMNRVIDREYGASLDGKTAIDLACHQGFFSTQLARRGCEVLGIDARQSHVEDSNLIAEALELPNMRARLSDVHALEPDELGRFDIVLMLGLIYHLENPVGAIRTAHALTKKVCLIETQVVPHLSGPVDWGNHTFVKELKGCFGIIDETHETHGPEASTLGICLAPSTPALLWIMEKVGFDRVELVPPPDNAYEQHRFGKRVMVAGFRD
ncbi:MAG: methyltransferase domain-containing protein [Xanthomonadales bacterium]|nr:methyltransferase domain-containing protein [Xanthomonadales bacterium]